MRIHTDKTNDQANPMLELFFNYLQLVRELCHTKRLVLVLDGLYQ